MSTQYKMDKAAEDRLGSYLALVGATLGNRKRRASFALYTLGLLSDAERKSVEPLACRGVCDPSEANPAHQRLLHFVASSRWDDHAMRLTSARYALEAIEQREPVEAWIFDDTGFIKQGKHSVGVQRQYTGSAGKVTNCQVAVSLTLATRTLHVPVDFDLYLPASWTEDAERRAEARIPDDVEFRTKPQMALDMARRAVADGLPTGVALADAAYGKSSAFRLGLRELGLDYAVDVESTTTLWPVRPTRLGQAKSALDLALAMGVGAFKRVAWREGTRRTLASNFARCRVVPCHDDGTPETSREELWFVAEWPDDEPAPTKFSLCALPKKRSLKELVRVLKQRWRTERMYEDMKGELGLDHYEGRGYPGWNHHVSVVLCAYAFATAELARSFPPSAKRSGDTGAHRRETTAALRRLAGHRAPDHFTSYRAVAATLPPVPSHQPASDHRVQSRVFASQIGNVIQ